MHDRLARKNTQLRFHPRRKRLAWIDGPGVGHRQLEISAGLRFPRREEKGREQWVGGWELPLTMYEDLKQGGLKSHGSDWVSSGRASNRMDRGRTTFPEVRTALLPRLLDLRPSMSGFTELTTGKESYTYAQSRSSEMTIK